MKNIIKTQKFLEQKNGLPRTSTLLMVVYMIVNIVTANPWQLDSKGKLLIIGR